MKTQDGIKIKKAIFIVFREAIMNIIGMVQQIQVQEWNRFHQKCVNHYKQEICNVVWKKKKICD